MGLAPQSSPEQYPYTPFVDELLHQQIIDQNMFSMLLAKEGTDSKVWFGGYDLTMVKNGLKDEFWQFEIDRMQDQEVENTIVWVNQAASLLWAAKV